MTTPPPDALEQVKRLEALADKVAAPGSTDKDVTTLLYALTWHASWLLPLARAQLEGWRPIETAPHGRDVLLGWYEGRKWVCETGQASHGSRNEVASSISYHGQATHWQPLPTPPQKDEGDD